MIKYKHKDRFGITTTVKAEGRLFVTKDKNGKDVFAGDKVRNQDGFACIVKYYPKKFQWGLHNPKTTDKKGFCVTWCDSFSPKDMKEIELIEDKEDA